MLRVSTPPKQNPLSVIECANSRSHGLAVTNAVNLACFKRFVMAYHIVNKLCLETVEYVTADIYIYISADSFIFGT